MTKKTLSNEEFLVVQLRDLAGSAEATPLLRMQALDRLAVLAGIYRVERRQPPTPSTARARAEREERAERERREQEWLAKREASRG